MAIFFESTGSFKNTENFLNRMSRRDIAASLHKYGRIGVSALSAATPVESGLTATSWTYEIDRSLGSWGISWVNTNRNSGASIAILLQYGHGTGTGGYVSGRDYINPAIQPIFDQIAVDVWKEVTRK